MGNEFGYTERNTIYKESIMSQAYDVVRKFEETVAEYAGAMYGVSVDSCCSALFLCCCYLFNTDIFADIEHLFKPTVRIPKKTYPGVASSIIHAGGSIQFVDKEWTGAYQLEPFPIWDSAMRFKKDMYVDDSFYCLSFNQHGKHIQIGRGGMILTDDVKARDWLRNARFDGRDPIPLAEDNFTMLVHNVIPKRIQHI